MTTRPSSTDGETGERGELRGEGFGGRDADLRASECAEITGGFARERAFRHIDDGERRQSRLLDVAHGFQRVHGLAGL